MDLPSAYQLLLAAEKRHGSFLSVTAGESDRQARMMANAGLIELTLNNNGRVGSTTKITAVTAAGLTFLRAFKGQPLSALTL